MLALLALSTASAQAPPAPDPAPAAAPAAAPEAPPAPSDELPIVEDPAILEYVEAPYPPEARAQGLEGAVRMRITLSDQGVVDEIEVIEPAGHGFDEAAVDAVLAMKWSPARTEQGPVGGVFEVTYNFVLEAAEPPPDA